MRFLTEKQYRAIHEGHALQVQYLQSDLHVIRSERDYYREARERANDLRITAVNERNAARAERETLRAELNKLKAAYSVRPMGLGEMLAKELDRVSKISADYNAAQADAALDSFDDKPWQPSDCIAGTPGCFCDSEVA